MSEVLDRVSALRREVERARAEKARHEARLDQAVAARDKALAGLRELGCASPEEAAVEAERLRSKLSDAVSEIEKRLKEATG